MGFDAVKVASATGTTGLSGKVALGGSLGASTQALPFPSQLGVSHGGCVTDAASGFSAASNNSLSLLGAILWPSLATSASWACSRLIPAAKLVLVKVSRSATTVRESLGMLWVLLWVCRCKIGFIKTEVKNYFTLSPRSLRTATYASQAIWLAA